MYRVMTKSVHNSYGGRRVREVGEKYLSPTSEPRSPKGERLYKRIRTKVKKESGIIALFLLPSPVRARSSVVEHPSDKGKVVGAIPTARTVNDFLHKIFLLSPLLLVPVIIIVVFSESGIRERSVASVLQSQSS